MNCKNFLGKLWMLQIVLQQKSFDEFTPEMKILRTLPLNSYFADPPDVNMGINKDVIKEFDEVVLTCKADANPSDVLYKWFKNDEVVVGDPTDTYAIPSITRDFNAAAISCEVSNKVGTTKSSYTLNVFCKYLRKILTVHNIFF